MSAIAKRNHFLQIDSAFLYRSKNIYIECKNKISLYYLVFKALNNQFAVKNLHKIIFKSNEVPTQGMRYTIFFKESVTRQILIFSAVASLHGGLCGSDEEDETSHRELWPRVAWRTSPSDPDIWNWAKWFI